MDDFINLANYVYTSGKTPSAFPLTDYQPLKYANGNSVERGITADGFYGQAFISNNAANPNVIIAFEGTNLGHHPPSLNFTKAQLLDDKDIFEGKNPKAYYAALNFTLKAIRTAEAQGVSSNNIYVDGHSLGGAEAEYVSTQLSLPGYTFGAPGIPSSDVIYTSLKSDQLCRLRRSCRQLFGGPTEAAWIVSAKQLKFACRDRSIHRKSVQHQFAPHDR